MVKIMPSYDRQDNYCYGGSAQQVPVYSVRKQLRWKSVVVSRKCGGSNTLDDRYDITTASSNKRSDTVSTRSRH
jgi:hypothetical protein